MRAKQREEREEFSRVREEITGSEEEIQRLRMSGLLYLSDVEALDRLEDELREFERITEQGVKQGEIHSIHDQLHALRSKIEEFSNSVHMV